MDMNRLRKIDRYQQLDIYIYKEREREMKKEIEAGKEKT